MTAQISNLVQVAREENEHVGEQFLGWFLEEQREEVASMSALLSVVERAGSGSAATRRGLPEPCRGDRSRPVEPRTAGGGRRPLARPRRHVGQGRLQPIEERNLRRFQPAVCLVEVEPLDPVDLGKRLNDA